VIKALSLLAKRADISVEQFHWHWREVHGPLALHISALRRYVQGHRLRDSVSGFPRLHQEGIVEVWLDDLAAAEGLGTNPEFTDYAGPDEPNFMDREQSLGLRCEERVLIPGPPIRSDDPGVKALLFLNARPGERERLDTWLDAKLTTAAGQLPGLRRLAAARPVPSDPVPPYAAVVELSWPDIAAYDRGWASEAGAALRDSLATVADVPASAATVVEEYRLIW
jgi:hypothetical protein